MVVRKCPKCKNKVYSADSEEQYWKCCYCGFMISKEYQEKIVQNDVVRRDDFAGS